MRAMMVSGLVLGVAAAFGLGVVVGRFVLNDDTPPAPAPGPATPGVDPFAPGADPLAPDLQGFPGETAAAPLPPATPPAPNPRAADASDLTARAESEAAMAAGAAPACDVAATRRMPIRTWASGDMLVARASGATCDAAVVRISVQSADGATLYTLAAPASDFGVAPGAGADALRDAIDRALPDSAVRARAYPAWTDAAPQASEFTREAYEAIRAADAPVVCIKLPTAPQRCVAADPAGGQVRVFSRG